MMSSEAEIELMDEDDESTPNLLLPVPVRTTDKLENLFELGPVFLIVNLANFEDEALRPNASKPDRGLEKLDNFRNCIQILGGRPYFHPSSHLVDEAIPIAYLTNDDVYNRHAINRWHELEAARELRRDIFNENFIHEIFQKPTSEELTYDLNAHRIGSSFFKPYIANNFIKNKLKWSELRPKAEIQGISPRSNSKERRPSSPPPVVPTNKQSSHTIVHPSPAKELFAENGDVEEMEVPIVNQLPKLPKYDVKVSPCSRKMRPFNPVSTDKITTNTSSRASSVDVMFAFEENGIPTVSTPPKKQKTSTCTSSRASSIDMFAFEENEIPTVATPPKKQKKVTKGATPSPSPKIQARLPPITYREQKAMLDFIIAKNYYRRIMSRSLYTEMVDQEVVKDRTSVTLASNMQKIVFKKRLYSFDLPMHIITKFEEYRDQPLPTSDFNEDEEILS